MDVIIKNCSNKRVAQTHCHVHSHTDTHTQFVTKVHDVLCKDVKHLMTVGRALWSI